MANTNAILSVEEEDKLRQPIDEYVGKIQAKIDELRKALNFDPADKSAVMS